MDLNFETHADSFFFIFFLSSFTTPMLCLQVLRVTSSRILNCKVVKDPASASRQNEYGELLDFNLVNAVNGGSGHSNSSTTTIANGTIEREGEEEEEDDDEEGGRGRTMMHGGRYLRVTKSHHFDDVKVYFFFLFFLFFFHFFPSLFFSLFFTFQFCQKKKIKKYNITCCDAERHIKKF